jgi:hypothetical protein
MNRKLAIIVVLMLGLMVGCGRTPVSLEKGSNDQTFSYQFSVAHDGKPFADAAVIVILSDGSDTLLATDQMGYTEFVSRKQANSAIGVSLGLSGTSTIADVGNVPIVLESIPKMAASELNASATYVFGVYNTNNDGDVRFRYQYNFSYFYCSYWLPWTLWSDPNPNHWTSWGISDFSPWLGKKLLVPRTYQYWYREAYHLPISSALFLVSTR